MFKIECCNGSRKCRVYELIKSRHYKNVYLKIGRCSKCKKLVAVIEKIRFDGKKEKPIRKYGVEALQLLQRNFHNIIHEIVLISKQGSKVPWTYYKAVNSETVIRRYIDESGNGGEKIHSPVKVLSA